MCDIKKGIRRDYALIGPRRVGKTSIIKKVLYQLEKKILTHYYLIVKD
jgi:predicted AAA+ superfamily ATPase